MSRQPRQSGQKNPKRVHKRAYSTNNGRQFMPRLSQTASPYQKTAQSRPITPSPSSSSGGGGSSPTLRRSPLSYRHLYHAGNHADVLKHAIVATLAAHHMRVNPNGRMFMDTHAGAGGVYDLSHHYATKNSEFTRGIARIHDLTRIASMNPHISEPTLLRKGIDQHDPAYASDPLYLRLSSPSSDLYKDIPLIDGHGSPGALPIVPTGREQMSDHSVLLRTRPHPLVIDNDTTPTINYTKSTNISTLTNRSNTIMADLRTQADHLRQHLQICDAQISLITALRNTLQEHAEGQIESSDHIVTSHTLHENDHNTTNKKGTKTTKGTKKTTITTTSSSSNTKKNTTKNRKTALDEATSAHPQSDHDDDNDAEDDAEQQDGDVPGDEFIDENGMVRATGPIPDVGPEKVKLYSTSDGQRVTFRKLGKKASPASNDTPTPTTSTTTPLFRDDITFDEPLSHGTRFVSKPLKQASKRHSTTDIMPNYNTSRPIYDAVNSISDILGQFQSQRESLMLSLIEKTGMDPDTITDEQIMKHYVDSQSDIAQTYSLSAAKLSTYTRHLLPLPHSLMPYIALMTQANKPATLSAVTPKPSYIDLMVGDTLSQEKVKAIERRQIRDTMDGTFATSVRLTPSDKSHYLRDIINGSIIHSYTSPVTQEGVNAIANVHTQFITQNTTTTTTNDSTTTPQKKETLDELILRTRDAINDSLQIASQWITPQMNGNLSKQISLSNVIPDDDTVYPLLRRTTAEEILALPTPRKKLQPKQAQAVAKSRMNKYTVPIKVPKYDPSKDRNRDMVYEDDMTHNDHGNDRTRKVEKKEKAPQRRDIKSENHTGDDIIQHAKKTKALSSLPPPELAGIGNLNVTYEDDDGELTTKYSQQDRRFDSNNNRQSSRDGQHQHQQRDRGQYNTDRHTDRNNNNNNNNKSMSYSRPSSPRDSSPQPRQRHEQSSRQQRQHSPAPLPVHNIGHDDDDDGIPSMSTQKRQPSKNTRQSKPSFSSPTPPPSPPPSAPFDPNNLAGLSLREIKARSAGLVQNNSSSSTPVSAASSSQRTETPPSPLPPSSSQRADNIRKSLHFMKNLSSNGQPKPRTYSTTILDIDDYVVYNTQYIQPVKQSIQSTLSTSLACRPMSATLITGVLSSGQSSPLIARRAATHQFMSSLFVRLLSTGAFHRTPVLSNIWKTLLSKEQAKNTPSNKTNPNNPRYNNNNKSNYDDQRHQAQSRPRRDDYNNNNNNSNFNNNDDDDGIPSSSSSSSRQYGRSRGAREKQKRHERHEKMWNPPSDPVSIAPIMLVSTTDAPSRDSSIPHDKKIGYGAAEDFDSFVQQYKKTAQRINTIADQHDNEISHSKSSSPFDRQDFDYDDDSDNNNNNATNHHHPFASHFNDDDDNDIQHLTHTDNDIDLDDDLSHATDAEYIELNVRPMPYNQSYHLVYDTHSNIRKSLPILPLLTHSPLIQHIEQQYLQTLYDDDYQNHIRLFEKTSTVDQHASWLLQNYTISKIAAKSVLQSMELYLYDDAYHINPHRSLYQSPSSPWMFQSLLRDNIPINDTLTHNVSTEMLNTINTNTVDNHNNNNDTTLYESILQKDIPHVHTRLYKGQEFVVKYKPLPMTRDILVMNEIHNTEYQILKSNQTETLLGEMYDDTLLHRQNMELARDVIRTPDTKKDNQKPEPMQNIDSNDNNDQIDDRLPDDMIAGHNSNNNNRSANKVPIVPRDANTLGNAVARLSASIFASSVNIPNKTTQRDTPQFSLSNEIAQKYANFNKLDTIESQQAHNIWVDTPQNQRVLLQYSGFSSAQVFLRQYQNFSDFFSRMNYTYQSNKPTQNMINAQESHDEQYNHYINSHSHDNNNIIKLKTKDEFVCSSLILCDPAYETGTEYVSVLDLLRTTLEHNVRGNHHTLAIWYPILDKVDESLPDPQPPHKLSSYQDNNNDTKLNINRVTSPDTNRGQFMHMLDHEFDSTPKHKHHTLFLQIANHLIKRYKNIYNYDNIDKTINSKHNGNKHHNIDAVVAEIYTGFDKHKIQRSNISLSGSGMFILSPVLKDELNTSFDELLPWLSTALHQDAVDNIFKTVHTVGRAHKNKTSPSRELPTLADYSLTWM